MKRETLREFKVLSGQEAMRLWPRIFDFINDALPPANGHLAGRKERVQQSLVSENLTLWVGMKDKEFMIVVTTTENVDSISGERSLLVYSMTISEALHPEDLRFGLEELKKYARAKGLSKITAFTGMDSLKTLFEKAGGKSTYVLGLEV